MFVSVHSALTNENILKKKAMSYWFKEVFGLILLSIIERVKRSIGGFTERYSEILSQSF